MRPHKKGLNKYPEHGQEVDVFTFAMDEDAGLPKVPVDPDELPTPVQQVRKDAPRP